MQKEQPIIVIGRSFGAGGRSVGKALSKILDIPFYDSELLMESAKEFGFSKEVFSRCDEKRPSIFKRLVTHSYGMQEVFMPVTIGSENIYQAQSVVIRGIAEKGPAIIIGRTADYLLRDYPNLLSVFIHAPLAYRARKIVDRGDAPDEVAAIELAKMIDRQRQEYYDFFTGKTWGTASNYDLTIDSSLLPVDDIARLIADLNKKLIQHRKNVKIR